MKRFYVVAEIGSGVLKAHAFEDKAAALKVADALGLGDDLVTVADNLDPFKTPQLLKLYNELTGEKVKRFADRKAAKTRTFEALGKLAVAGAIDSGTITGRVEAPKAPKAPKADKVSIGKPSNNEPVPAVAAGFRKSKGVNIPALERAVPCRAGSKQARLLDMLAAPNGATMSELIDNMANGGRPWREATVRSGFYWDMHTIKGYGVRTEHMNLEQLDAAGHKTDAAAIRKLPKEAQPGITVAVYFIVLPKKLSAPLPHEPMKKAAA